MICTALLLSFLLLPSSVLSKVVICTQHDKAEFLQNQLTPECAAGLIALQMRLSPQGQPAPELFVPSASMLDTVCHGSCGGAYAEYLRGECDDPYAARMVEASCIFTADTASVGPRCRFAFPDAIDDLRGAFARVFSCGLGESQGSCPSGCKSAMNALIDNIGCCYPSLYNNTEFLIWMQDIGLINDTLVQSVQVLGKAPEWNLCVANIPPMCEMIRSEQSEPSSAVGCMSFTILFMALTAFWTLIHQ